MSRPRWHHHLTKRLRDFHRREGAFTALSFAIIFSLGILNVVGAQTQMSDNLTHFSDTILELTSSSAKTAEYTVEKVIDGDTILLTNGEYVRYIGIDTPEIYPETHCFAQQATVRNRELVEGQVVHLVKDVSDRDRGGRWLRYVYVGDVLINEVLVQEGFARASSYPPDTSFSDQLQLAQTTAQLLNLGRWAVCDQANLP